MSSLQRKLADATVVRNAAVAYNKEAEEAAGRRGYPWPAEAWSEASLMSRPKALPSRLPFLLNPDGPVSSASELQELAEMESLPEVMEVSRVDLRDQEIGKVTICDIGDDEWKRMKEKADVTFDIGTTVMFEGKRRFVLVAKALKEDVMRADDDGDKDGDEEGSVGGETGEEVVAGSSEPGDKDGDADGSDNRDGDDNRDSDGGKEGSRNGHEDGNKNGNEEGNVGGNAGEEAVMASSEPAGAEPKSGLD